jgi:predicted Rossmann fold nucleotide-binding protein DprA/Smf involved in DNA uptake
MTIDEIARELSLEVPEVGSALSILSIRAIVEEFNGKYIIE